LPEEGVGRGVGNGLGVEKTLTGKSVWSRATGDVGVNNVHGGVSAWCLAHVFGVVEERRAVGSTKVRSGTQKTEGFKGEKWPSHR